MASVMPKSDGFNEDINERDEATLCSALVTVIITFLSLILVLGTFPLSLCVCIRMVQEYERAVIFRLGRVKKKGAVGPGLFFILPCMDQVIHKGNSPCVPMLNSLIMLDRGDGFEDGIVRRPAARNLDQGQRDCSSGCCHLLQDRLSHGGRLQRERLCQMQ